MFEAAKKFAQRVILIHLALLLVVIALLTLGARQIYVNARQQQITSTSEKQLLLARQTARGIEARYSSITQDLELVLRSDGTSEDASRPAELMAPADNQPFGPGGGQGGPGGPGGPGFGGPGGQGFGSGPGGPGGGPGGPGGFGNGPGGPGPGNPGNRGGPNNPNGRGGAFGPGGRVPRLAPTPRIIPANNSTLQLMALQLRGRISDLFIVEAKSAADAKTGEATKTASISFSYPDKRRGIIQKIADRNLDWITSLTDTKISGFTTLDNNEPCHLIAVPAQRSELGPDRTFKPVPCTLVAVVPLDYIKQDFFDPFNSEGLTNAALLDSHGNILIAMNSSLVGLNVLTDFPAEVADSIQPFIQSTADGTTTITAASTFKDLTLPPRIATFEEVSKDFDAQGRPEIRPSADHWVVMIASPLAATETIVNGVFKSALFWGIFVALSVTGLFFSSSVFLIRSRIKYERQRSDLLTRELTQARDIQLAWLPKPGSTPPGLDIAAVNLPASHISGDFYNWFSLPNGRVAVVIGDVTGHGMSAAFLMSTSQILVRTTLLRLLDPGKCLEEVNRQLCTQNFAGQFVTMLLMVLDPVQCTIEIAAAGHPAPLVANRCAFRALEIETQLVLGVDPATRYPTQSYVLHPGSTMLLYTDGVVEAESATGTMFQTVRLLASVSKDFPSAKAIVDQVVADVRAYTATGELNDDLTLVALQLLPVPTSAKSPPAIATKL